MKIIRIADHVTLSDPVLHDSIFEDCIIHGPAVLAIRNFSIVEGCTFDADLDSLVIKVTQNRVYGVIAADSTTFRRCQFVGVGLLVHEAFYDDVRRGFGVR